MDKTTCFLLGVVAWAVVRKRAAEKARVDAWQEDVPVNGTDFQGDLWARLAGTDLLAPLAKDRNLANSTIADPGRVGRADLGLVPGWNGNL